MSVGLSLLTYAVLLSVLGPLLLSGRAATRLFPRLGVLAWHVATLSVVGAGVVGGLVLAMPAVPHGLDSLIAACSHGFPDGAAAGGVAAQTAGLVLTGAVLARTAWSVSASLLTG